MWTNSLDNPFCSGKNPVPCSLSGTYDVDASSTYQGINNDFEIEYVDGKYAKGDFGADSVRIGGCNLKEMQFGVGYESSISTGILGIGPSFDGNPTMQGSRKPYKSLPQVLVDQGCIRSNAYSVWLNDLQAKSGSVLFGGVDMEKFYGPLHTLPVARIETLNSALLTVTLTGLSMLSGEHKQSVFADQPFPVVLDTGSTFNYIPSALIGLLCASLQEKYDQQLTYDGVVNCSLKDSKDSLVFNFPR
ncbi:MAG: hypothetical protein Q9222_001521 [Ikaeria aurantiellina]